MDSIDIITLIVACLACVFLIVGLVLLILIFIGYKRKNYRPIDVQEESAASKPKFSEIFYEREGPDPVLPGPDNEAVVQLRKSIQLNSYTRRSKSALDISDGRRKASRDEVEFPLLSRQKEDEMVSQYFDAQETLDDSEDDFEDIEDDRFDEKEELKGRHRRTKRVARVYTKEEKKRINALKILLLQQKRLEGEFHRELFLLESHYDEEKSGIYDQRRELIEGENDGSGTQDKSSGVPGFWLQVLLNSRNLKHIVQATDMAALEHLVDVSVVNLPKQNGFRITFNFKENEWFKNLVLTKDYLINFQPPSDASVIHYEGPEVVQCTGSKISWYRHKNLTIRPVKKVQNHKIVTKFARKNSFFNFFNPPTLPPQDDPAFTRKRELLEAHIQIGLFFKEYLIPKAYLFYKQPDFDKHIEKGVHGRRPQIGAHKHSSSTTPNRKLSGEVEVFHLSTSRIDTPSARKLSISTQASQETKRRLSGSQVSTKSSKTSPKKPQEPTKTSQNPQESNGLKKHHETNGKPPELNTSRTSEKELNSLNSSRDINDNKNRKSDDVELEERLINPEESDPSGKSDEPEVDELVGKYRMESSDKFDEFMRALGVGMMRRKLAGSVVPVNVIEISEDKTYTIRTLTNVRNSEISFRLGEPFIEDTLDGRRANTTATREGNLLTLNQRGNPGEKDTVMTREVTGDTLKLEMLVDNIVCTRIYKRIEE